MSEKQKHTVNIGTKELSFEADMNNPDEVRMANDFQRVAATRPASIQEFFTRLQQVQHTAVGVERKPSRGAGKVKRVPRSKGPSR